MGFLTGNKCAKAKRRVKGSGYLTAIRGRWVMRWRVNGREVQEATQFAATASGRKRAEALLAERTEIFRLKDRQTRLQVLIAKERGLAARIRELQTIAGGARAATLGGLAEMWRGSPRRKDCSREQEKRYTAHIARFVRWAGAGVDVRAVDDDMVERYARHLSGLSGRTYNNHISTLAAVWRAVGKSAGASGNPWSELPRRRLETHARRALTPGEVAALRAAASGEDRALVEIGLRTGLRLGDASGLTWGAFRRAGFLEVTTRKTGAMVRLPSEGLLAALAACGFTPGAAGEPVLPKACAMYARCPSELSHRIGRVFDRAGVRRNVSEAGWQRARPETGYHSLRHTFVSRAIEAGVPAAIVQALVGHASATMTSHYTHVSADAVKDAFARCGFD